MKKRKDDAPLFGTKRAWRRRKSKAKKQCEHDKDICHVKELRRIRCPNHRYCTAFLVQEEVTYWCVKCHATLGVERDWFEDPKHDPVCSGWGDGWGDGSDEEGEER